MRLPVDLGPDVLTMPDAPLAISPDGTRLVFSVRGVDGKPRLMSRLLTQSTAALLSGTENATDAFFSPDGRWVGFFADGKMKKIAATGGAPVTITDAPNPRGASWGEDGVIVVSLGALSVLFGVPASGGAPQRLTTLERGEVMGVGCRPLPLPDAEQFELGQDVVDVRH